MMSMTRRLIPMGGGGASSSSGSYEVSEAAANITGFGAGTAPAFTINWKKTGNIVTLTLADGGTYSGTSNATTFTITGLPKAIRPALAQFTGSFSVLDPTGVIGRAQIGTTGILTFQRGSVSGADLSFSATGFGAAATKGLASSWQVIYALP